MARTRTPSRRKQHRYDVSGASNAFVELTHPQPGGPLYKLPLCDIGVSGLRFSFTEEFPGIEVGTSFSPVAICIGDCRIRGELVIMHLTEVSESVVHAGALFYPASDEELILVKGVVAGLDAAQSPSEL